ncbi:MAG: thioredoxin family protein [Gelidibacter sp.]
MRNYLFALIFLLSLSVSAQEVQLSWQKDFNVAVEMAKSENKPILIYFNKSNCDECLQFYTSFFKQKTFDGLSNDFVLLMLDGSNNDMKTNDLSVIKQRRMVMHYNKASRFPAVLVIDQNRQEMGDLFTSNDKNDISTYCSFLESIK